MLARGYGDAADWLLEGDAMAVDYPQPVSPNVEKITGRSARTFAEWVASHAEVFEPQ